MKVKHKVLTSVLLCAGILAAPATGISAYADTTGIVAELLLKGGSGNEEYHSEACPIEGGKECEFTVKPQKDGKARSFSADEFNDLSMGLAFIKDNGEYTYVEGDDIEKVSIEVLTISVMMDAADDKEAHSVDLKLKDDTNVEKLSEQAAEGIPLKTYISEYGEFQSGTASSITVKMKVKEITPNPDKVTTTAATTTTEAATTTTTAATTTAKATTAAATTKAKSDAVPAGDAGVGVAGGVLAAAAAVAAVSRKRKAQ